MPRDSVTPEAEAGDNWISFSFVSSAGFDRAQGTVHGSPQFVAEKFGIVDFDGRMSTLMLRATDIALFWQVAHEAKEHPEGKAETPAGKPGQPAGSLRAPDWAGDAPLCSHDKRMRYKSLLKKDGTTGHLWECIAKPYPDPAQCPAEWINRPSN